MAPEMTEGAVGVMADVALLLPAEQAVVDERVELGLVQPWLVGMSAVERDALGLLAQEPVQQQESFE